MTMASANLPDADKAKDHDDSVERRRESNPDTPSRLSIEKARVGNELSADPLSSDEAESTEALKRTAEDECLS